ncbi:hypothetical protein [Microbacterium sp. GCS4]|uniref:hypothetical protein n=1 Tax=Microbacterium sp. GCS4 TaxID=1692239 RepID=UPI00128FC038|nr:hypothetical protein [Microbacterium sp. GCS4]
MDDGERAFWEAVVQIIPVLLLALVVEARALKPSQRRLKKLRKKLQSLGQPQLRSVLRYGMRFNRMMWESGGMSLYMMLLVAILLTVAELVGLIALYVDSPPSMFWMGVSIGGLAMGVLMVALAPVAATFGRLLWAAAEPPRSGPTRGKSASAHQD